MTNQEIIVVILVGVGASVFLHFLYISWLLQKCLDATDLLISPVTLHRLTKMNWVGCIIYWILGLALAPLFTITGIFAWLFTVGRRN